MKQEGLEGSLPATLEEFEKELFERPESVSKLQQIFDKALDVYDELPLLVKLLPSFDKTGVFGAIAQMISEHSAKRKRENIICALFYMEKAIQQHEKKLKNLESKGQHISVLTERYFEYSRRTYQQNKIEWFRNVWLNGILRGEDSLDQKFEVFDLVSTLTEEQIIVLKYMYDNQNENDFLERKPVHISQLAKALGFDTRRSQQICISLQGRGLLHDYGIGKYNYHGPVSFVMTDYVSFLVLYIIDPEQT